jgi:hypothetical protein
MIKSEALKILGLSEENSEDNILQKQALMKMLRRYPPEQFPEKAEKIRKAFSLLQQKDDYWIDFFCHPNAFQGDLTFLLPYLEPLLSSTVKTDTNELMSIGNYFFSKSLADHIFENESYEDESYEDEDFF